MYQVNIINQYCCIFVIFSWKNTETNMINIISQQLRNNHSCRFHDLVQQFETTFHKKVFKSENASYPLEI